LEELIHHLVIEVWLIEQESLEEMEAAAAAAAAGGGGKLKLYADFNSPFARAVILFCRCAPENKSVMSSKFDGKEIEPICNSQFGMWEMGLRLEQSILGYKWCSGWFTPDL
jgi:hypothetical protein